MRSVETVSAEFIIEVPASVFSNCDPGEAEALGLIDWQEHRGRVALSLGNVAGPPLLVDVAHIINVLRSRSPDPDFPVSITTAWGERPWLTYPRYLSLKDAMKLAFDLPDFGIVGPRYEVVFDDRANALVEQNRTRPEPARKGWRVIAKRLGASSEGMEREAADMLLRADPLEQPAAPFVTLMLGWILSTASLHSVPRKELPPHAIAGLFLLVLSGHLNAWTAAREVWDFGPANVLPDHVEKEAFRAAEEEADLDVFVEYIDALLSQ